jgi:hypothetical protein
MGFHRRKNHKKHYKLDIPGQKRILSYRLAPSFRWVVGGRYSGAVDIKLKL